MARVSLERVSKTYPDGTVAVNDLNLEIADGELVVFVGPSGCGKTTALRMVAGLEEITDGEIRIGDRVVNDLAPRDRDIAMVFQNYALYPHKTVYENLVFGLRMRKVPKSEQRRRVEEIARILGLEEMLERRPAQLSGGQRQRVAMGRAIVREPQAFLMDEPLSNLDAKLRVQMRAEIARIQQTLRVTTLYVTHDQVEAMTMGHRVAVMRSGVLQQVDTPQRLYDLPGNLFVASFVGSPAMNLLDVALEREGGGLVCRSGGVEIELPVDIAARRPQLEQYVGRRLALGIRPEALSESSTDPDAPRIRGRALLVEALGAESLAHVEVNAMALDRPELVDVSAAQAHLLPVGDRTATLLARLEHDTGVKPGHVVDLAADVRRLHFFDLDTGSAIPVAGVPVTAAVV